MHFICANTFEKLMRIRQRAKIMLFVLVCLTQYAAAKLSEILKLFTLFNWAKKGKPVWRLKNLSKTNQLKDGCHTTTLRPQTEISSSSRARIYIFCSTS